MWKLLLVPTMVFAQGAPPRAWEVRLGAGVFNVAPDGADVQLQVRPGGSPWMAGVRFVQWVDRIHDPFTGRALTDTREQRYGITLDYLFRPDRRFSWTVGASILRWTKAEKSLYTGEVGRDATTGLCLGGGVVGNLGSVFTYHAGIYLAPGVRLHTQTSVSSEDDSGSFDIRAGFGVRF